LGKFQSFKKWDIWAFKCNSQWGVKFSETIPEGLGVVTKKKIEKGKVNCEVTQAKPFAGGPNFKASGPRNGIGR